MSARHKEAEDNVGYIILAVIAVLLLIGVIKFAGFMMIQAQRMNLDRVRWVTATVQHHHIFQLAGKPMKTYYLAINGTDYVVDEINYNAIHDGDQVKMKVGLNDTILQLQVTQSVIH